MIGHILCLWILFRVTYGTIPQQSQQQQPIYHHAASVVSHSGGSLVDRLALGKSLSGTSGSTNTVVAQSPTSSLIGTQPIAEERDSAFQTSDPSNLGQLIGTPVGSTSGLPNSGTTNPQAFKILYLANGGGGPNGGAPGNGGGGGGGAYPQNYGGTTEVSWWRRFHMEEILVAIISLLLVVGGGFLLYPKFAGVRARALRELGLENISSEDTARLTRSVFKALERLYDMNNTK